MAHDSDAINSAHKKEIFDDSFDPLALSISAQEKKTIARNLDSAKKKIEQSMPAQSVQQAGVAASSAPYKKQQPVKKGFFRKFFRFFLFLFGGARGEEYVIKKRLKSLRRQLKRIKPVVFNFKKKTVSSQLAVQLFALFEYLMPYKSVFSNIFNQKKDDVSKLDFYLAIVRCCSSNQHVDKISMFSEENLSNAVTAYPEAQLKEKIKDMLKKYVGSYSAEDRKTINRIYNEMRCVNGLYDFDFIGFFDRFHKDFSLHKRGKPAFNDAQPLGVVPFLKKLQTALVRIELTVIPAVFETARRYYQQVVLAQAQSNEKAIFSSMMERMSKSGCRPLTGAISKLLEGEKLSLLVRYISKEFSYQPLLKRQKGDLFRDFAKVLVDEVNRRLAKLYKAKARDNLSKKIFSLLNVKELPAAYVYSIEKNDLLKKHSLPTFVYPKLLNFIVLFFSEVYSGGVRAFLNKIVAEGHFESNDIMRALSDKIQAIDSSKLDFDEFCLLVLPGEDKGKLLEMMINKFNNSAPSRNALSIHINSLNKNLAERIDTFRGSIRGMLALLSEQQIRNCMYRAGQPKDPKVEPQFQEIEKKLSLALNIMHQLESG